ncbi:MAG: ECF transporter S component [Bacillota bacterium]
MRNERLYRMVMIAMMGSMAFLLMYFGEIYVPPFAEFLKYDPGDVPAVVATYTMGPAAGVAVQGIKAGAFFLSGKSTAGWVGVLANFLAGAGLVLGAGIAHRLLEKSGLKHWGWGFLSAAIGTIVMAAVLIPVLATLIYPAWGMQGPAAWTAALTISTPFNLFKGFVSSTISLAFYRRLQPFLVGHPVHKAA